MGQQSSSAAGKMLRKPKKGDHVHDASQNTPSSRSSNDDEEEDSGTPSNPPVAVRQHSLKNSLLKPNAGSTGFKPRGLSVPSNASGFSLTGTGNLTPSPSPTRPDSPTRDSAGGKSVDDVPSWRQRKSSTGSSSPSASPPPQRTHPILSSPPSTATPVASSPTATSSDARNPFCAPLDHIREEERPLLALAEISHFDHNTLRKLHLIFDEISESGIDDGIIDASELTAAMGLDKDCLLARALFRIFDLTKTRKINFRTWVTTLSALSAKASMEEKIKFSFSLYDLNEDGQIDVNELRTLLAAAVRENVLSLTEEQVQEVCNHTLRHVDRDKNGFVDFNEYREVVSKSRRFVESFTLDIPRMLQSFRVEKRLTQEEAAKKQELWGRRRERQRQKDAAEDNSGSDGLRKIVQATKNALAKDKEAFQPGGTTTLNGLGV